MRVRQAGLCPGRLSALSSCARRTNQGMGVVWPRGSPFLCLRSRTALRSQGARTAGARSLKATRSGVQVPCSTGWNRSGRQVCGCFFASRLCCFLQPPVSRPSASNTSMAWLSISWPTHPSSSPPTWSKTGSGSCYASRRRGRSWSEGASKTWARSIGYGCGSARDLAQAVRLVQLNVVLWVGPLQGLHRLDGRDQRADRSVGVTDQMYLTHSLRT